MVLPPRVTHADMMTTSWRTAGPRRYGAATLCVLLNLRSLQGRMEVAASKPPSKPEEGWTGARLIPTTGIGGQDDQERRATSSLLAVTFTSPASTT